MTECDEAIFGPRRDSIYVVVPLTVVYVVILITGTVGNISTCVVIARNKSMHTATNYYLFSLAVSDLLLLVAGLPQEIYLFWSRYPYVFGETFCFLRGLFAETSGNATVLTITAFTVERYLAICHPFLSHTLSKLSRAVKLILLIWILSIGLAIPQAMPLEVIGSCPQCMVKETLIEHAFELSTFLFFIAPMTLITVLYVLIGLRLKSSRMMKKRISNNARIQSSSSRKVIKMLDVTNTTIRPGPNSNMVLLSEAGPSNTPTPIAVVVAFFICWAPFHVQRLYSIYQRPSPEMHYLHLKIYELVTYISGILYYMSATVNPILYNIMSAKFREAFKETFSCCCRINNLSHSGSQRSYSALSRSNLKGPDSNDSGSHDHTIQTNTSTNRNTSMESFNSHGKKIKMTSGPMIVEDVESRGRKSASEVELQDIQILPAAYPIKSTHSSTKTTPKYNKLLQLCDCIARTALDDSKGLKTSHPSAVKEQNILKLVNEERENEKEVFNRCTDVRKTRISNTSLKDIEVGAIEDELTIYMNELKQRELCS